MQSLDDLRHTLGDRAVTKELLEAVLRPSEFAELRRWYFPRWRPNRTEGANQSLRSFRQVVVEDTFEQQIVLAVAPSELRVRVKIAPRVREAVLKRS